MANIADFKSKLAGGGARSNQFKVTCPFPGYSQVGGEIETMAFLCKGAELPASTVGETKLTFTPADAATNCFTTGSKIAFMCFEDGTWHIATEMTGAAAAVTGAFAFAA